MSSKQQAQLQRVRWASPSGFTLAELIIVIVLLGILSTVAIPIYTGYLEESDRQVMQMRASSLDAAKRTFIMRRPNAAATFSGVDATNFNDFRAFMAAETPTTWAAFSVGEYFQLNVPAAIDQPTGVQKK